MSQRRDQEKWDARYREQRDSYPDADILLSSNPSLLPQAGRALDLACGLGANALWLAARGLEVAAWDISPLAIAQLRQQANSRGLAVDTRVCDVTRQPPAAQSFDVIVVCRFLERRLCPAIAAALRPGGLLFYQTFSHTAASGPRNPCYRLAPGELRKLFPELEMILYSEGEETQLVARRPTR